MNQEEALRVFKLGKRVWIETDDPPKIQVGKLVEEYDDGFFLFRSDSGITDYMAHCGRVYFVPIKPEQSWFSKILRVLFPLRLRFFKKRVN